MLFTMTLPIAKRGMTLRLPPPQPLRHQRDCQGIQGDAFGLGAFGKATVQLASHVEALVEGYVQQGVGTLGEAIEKAVADLHAIGVKVTPEQVRDAYAGRVEGKALRKPVESEATRTNAAFKAQAKAEGVLNDLQSGKLTVEQAASEMRGKPRGTPSERRAGAQSATAKVKSELPWTASEKLARRITQAQGRGAKLEDVLRDLKSGKITAEEAKARLGRKVAESSKALDAQRELNAQTRAKIDAEIEKLRKKHWSEYLVKVQRFAILTGQSIVEKLAGATGWGQLFAGLEAPLKGAFRRLPGLGAATEGASFGMGAVKALAKYATKETWIESLKKALTGENKLDRLYGDGMKKLAQDPDFSNIPGHIHGALKTPRQFAAFEESLVDKLNRAHAEGKDISNPDVLSAIHIDAYGDSLREIFQNTNEFSDSVNRAMHAPKSKGVQSFLQTLAPIKRVPANITGRMGEYAFGLEYGLYKHIKGLREGTLTPEQANAVVRAYARGSIGAGLAAYIWTNPSSNFVRVGGWYDPNAKGKDANKNAGKVWLFGKEVPKAFVHAPAFEFMQMVQTVHNAWNRRKKLGLGASAEDATLAVLHGTVEALPGTETMMSTSEALTNRRKAEQALANYLKGIAVPQAVQQTTKALDDKKRRYPRGFLEDLMVGVPGLNSRVPSAKATPSKSVGGIEGLAK